MNPFVVRSGPVVTREMVDLARHQIDQQVELDELSDRLERHSAALVVMSETILARTRRLQTLEVGTHKLIRDVALLSEAVSDLLTDILPAQEARVLRDA